MNLRPYQIRAIERAREELSAGHKAVLFVSPTGSGKTVIMAQIIRQAIAKGKRCDFLSHRAELNRQCALKLLESGVPESEIQVCGGGRVQGSAEASVRIGSVQTLHRTGARDCSLLFVDEAHRSMAKQHMELIVSYRERGARVLGFTATPARLDGASLGDVYERMVIVSSPAELLGEGFIVNPTIYTVPEKDLPSLEGVGAGVGDYLREQLAEAVARSELIGSITDHWFRRARQPSICFAVNRAHSTKIVEAFRRRGIKALHVDGSSTDRERSEAISKLRSGEVQVVSQCELWIEGVDIPEVRCAILARPTQSVTVYLQSVGRVMRPYKGLPALVLDHAGNVRRLGLPVDDRGWTLSPGKVRVQGPPKAKACPDCYMVMANAESECPSCGYKFGQPIEEKDVRSKRGELVLLREQEVWEKRRQHWIRMWEHAWLQEDPPSYVRERFMDRFKVEPKPDWQEPERSSGPEVEIAWLKKMSAKAFYGKLSWREIDRMFLNRFGHPRV